MQQSPLKTKLKCLDAQTFQNKNFISSLPFPSKEANNRDSCFLNYIDFYNESRGMSILFLPSFKSAPSCPPKLNSTVSFCRVLTAGRNAILHSCLVWLTLLFFSFNLCPNSSYLMRNKCVKSLIICFKNKIHTFILLILLLYVRGP